VLVRLVGLLIVARNVFAANYERTDRDLHEKSLRADYVFKVEYFDPQFTEAVAVCLVDALNTGRNLNRLHY
jgi:hypothetical protein